MLDSLKDMALSQLIWTVVELALAAAVTYGLSKLPRASALGLEWLSSKVVISKNERVEGIKRRFIDLVGQKVLWAEQVLVMELKDKAADGKITKAELLEALVVVKTKVIARVKEDAANQGLWGLGWTLVFGKEVDLVKWLEETVEASVAKLPPSGLQSPTLDGAPAAIDLGTAVAAPVSATETLTQAVKALPYTSGSVAESSLLTAGSVLDAEPTVA